MARTNLTDYLQAYPFWLFDVAPVELLSLPLFTPVLGFSAISMPEMTFDTIDVNEANWLFSKTVVKKGSVGNITLNRAAHWIDSDFYKWALTAIQGSTGGASLLNGGLLGNGAGGIGGVTPRRDLLLIQFMSRSPFEDPVANKVAAAAGLAGITGLAATQAGQPPNVAQVASLGAAATAIGTGGFGPIEFAARLPAKAWMLYGCMPVRYKPGSDLDANSGAISIAEMDVSVDYFDEIGLAS